MTSFLRNVLPGRFSGRAFSGQGGGDGGFLALGVSWDQVARQNLEGLRKAAAVWGGAAGKEKGRGHGEARAGAGSRQQAQARPWGQ